ncbi:MAG: class I SAM-dependent methyltransferase [Acidobacteria bacterium]|nr:class I SAM-dependent methyltransferase [Acidobacteriota bacterium]
MTTENKPNPPAGACTQPLCSGGAVAFFERHGQSNFLDSCYLAAPVRIQAALAAELEFLRRAVAGKERVLEIGCGDGRLLEALAASARAWVGLDLMESYLRYARAERRLAPGTGLAAGRAGGLPFADGAFDAVVCAQNTLGLLGEEKLATVREAARVLRPGGALFFVVYSEYSLVPRIEWYAEMHRRGMMAALDWQRSTPELLITEDGHASECFRRDRLEELFAAAGLAPSIEPLGEIYWAVTARKDQALGKGGVSTPPSASAQSQGL